MFAGQVGRHKGVDLLIQSAGKLREDGFDDFSVDIYGKAMDSSFGNMIQQAGLKEFVTLKGPRRQAELWDLYCRYDVFAFPTWEREPFAFAPLEAAAHGCVPVMSSLCGNAEWFVHDVHCLKAERTAQAFYEVFRDMLMGRIDLEPLGRRGRAVVWRDFHLEAILPRIERALQRAARRSRYSLGLTQQAYRMALLAEKLIKVTVQEPFCA